MIRFIRRGVSLLALIFGLAIVGVLAWSAWAKHETAEAVAIHTPHGIDEEQFVRINGIEQWITIRGRDRRNPVLLIVHGGPGAPLSYLLRQFQPMEQNYVVVQWDQRGGGKTLVRSGWTNDPSIDMSRMLGDGIAVSEYLRERLQRDKIIIVGHSWGSILGARMAQARPDLYSAFVGCGMAARTQPEWQRWIYPELATRMKAAGDAKRLAELLQQVGPPPWADDSPQMAHLEHVGMPYLPRVPGHFAHVLILLGTPHWSLADIYAIPRGMNAMLHSALWKPGVRDGYLAGSNVFAVPVVVIQGGDDLTTPAVFTRRWLDRVQAPAKGYAVLPGQGHEALSFDNAAFTRALDATLLPILAANAK